MWFRSTIVRLIGDVLEELDRDLDEGKKAVRVKDLDDKMKEYGIEVPKHIRETRYRWPAYPFMKCTN